MSGRPRRQIRPPTNFDDLPAAESKRLSSSTIGSRRKTTTLPETANSGSSSPLSEVDPSLPDHPSFELNTHYTHPSSVPTPSIPSTRTPHPPGPKKRKIPPTSTKTTTNRLSRTTQSPPPPPPASVTNLLEAVTGQAPRPLKVVLKVSEEDDSAALSRDDVGGAEVKPTAAGASTSQVVPVPQEGVIVLSGEEVKDVKGKGKAKAAIPPVMSKLKRAAGDVVGASSSPKTSTGSPVVKGPPKPTNKREALSTSSSAKSEMSSNPPRKKPKTSDSPTFTPNPKSQIELIKKASGITPGSSPLSTTPGGGERKTLEKKVVENQKRAEHDMNNEESYKALFGLSIKVRSSQTVVCSLGLLF